MLDHLVFGDDYAIFIYSTNNLVRWRKISTQRDCDVMFFHVTQNHFIRCPKFWSTFFQYTPEIEHVDTQKDGIFERRYIFKIIIFGI